MLANCSSWNITSAIVDGTWAIWYSFESGKCWTEENKRNKSVWVLLRQLVVNSLLTNRHYFFAKAFFSSLSSSFNIWLLLSVLLFSPLPALLFQVSDMNMWYQIYYVLYTCRILILRLTQFIWLCCMCESAVSSRNTSTTENSKVDSRTSESVAWLRAAHTRHHCTSTCCTVMARWRIAMHTSTLSSFLVISRSWRYRRCCQLPKATWQDVQPLFENSCCRF